MTVPAKEVRRGLLARTATKARVGVRRVRRQFWVVGALGFAAVVSAVAVFPSTAATDVASPGATATSSADASRPVASADITAGPGAAIGRASGAPSGSAEKGSDRSIAGDDPVAATKALLTARERCMRTLSVICLDGVDQAGSAALDGDRQVIRSLQEKGTATRERSLADATVALSQRLGDSALMTIKAATVPDSTGSAKDNGEPASLLLIKSEAGWRIRDLFKS